RYSMTIFLSSTYPSSRRPWRNASTRTEIEARGGAFRNPIRGIFVVCCASTELQSAKSMAQSANTVIFLFMFFPALSLDTSHSPFFSLDHLIRPRQHVRRNSQTELLGSF